MHADRPFGVEQVAPRCVGHASTPCALGANSDSSGHDSPGAGSSAGSAGEVADLEGSGVSDDLLASLRHTWALFDRFDRARERLHLAAAQAFGGAEAALGIPSSPIYMGVAPASQREGSRQAEGAEVGDREGDTKVHNARPDNVLEACG